MGDSKMRWDVDAVKGALSSLGGDSLLDLFVEANAYDSSFPFCNTWESVGEYLDARGLSAYEAVVLVIDSGIDDYTVPVRSDGCGGIETVDRDTLWAEARENVGSLAAWACENRDYVEDVIPEMAEAIDSALR